LPLCLMAYNCSVHSSTNETPFYLMHGFDPILPNDPEILSKRGCFSHTVPSYKQFIIDTLHHVWVNCKNELEEAHQRQKIQYDKNAVEPSYQPQDLVYVHRPVIAQGNCRKLSHYWYGPYRVLEVNSPNLVVQLVGFRKAKPKTIHFNQAKPCKEPRIPPLYTYDPLDRVEEGDPNLQAEFPEEEEVDEVAPSYPNPLALPAIEPDPTQLNEGTDMDSPPPGPSADVAATGPKEEIEEKPGPSPQPVPQSDSGDQQVASGIA